MPSLADSCVLSCLEAGTSAPGRVYQATYFKVTGSLTPPAAIHEQCLIRGLDIILGGAVIWWGKRMEEWA